MCAKNYEKWLRVDKVMAMKKGAVFGPPRIIADKNLWLGDG